MRPAVAPSYDRPMCRHRRADRLKEDGERLRCHPTADARCAPCGRPLDDTPALSSHRTSQGLISYRRCACGRISVERDGTVLCGTGRTCHPVSDTVNDPWVVPYQHTPVVGLQLVSYDTPSTAIQ